MHAAIEAQASTAYDDSERTLWRDRITEAKLREEIEDAETTFCVIDHPKGPIAMASRQKATIRYLYVHPEWNRQGIGTRLMAHMETEARREGLTALELEASRNAVPLYHRLGYRETGETGCGTGDRILCTHMRKSIA